MTEESFLICDKRLSEGEVLTVKERGLQTLTASSKKWQDGKHVHFQGCSAFTVHVKCQKSYTKETNIAALIRGK
jgi:hypothetical protein